MYLYLYSYLYLNCRLSPHFSFPFSFPFPRTSADSSLPAGSNSPSSTHPSYHPLCSLSLLVYDHFLWPRNYIIFRCWFYTTLVDYCKASRSAISPSRSIERQTHTGENLFRVLRSDRSAKVKVGLFVELRFPPWVAIQQLIKLAKWDW